MKRNIVVAIMIGTIGMATAAHAFPPYAFELIQIDSTGTTDGWSYAGPPNGGNDNAVYGIDGSTHAARFYAAAGSITLSNGVMSVTPPTQSSDTRSLDSCFQVSSTHDAEVHYSVEISATLSVSSGEKGTVFLESYTDSGCSTGTLVLGQASNSNTGTLTVSQTSAITSQLSGRVPAGRWVKIRTVQDTGSPAFSFKSGVKELF